MLVHPDKNMGSPLASESFKKLQCAYEVESSHHWPYLLLHSHCLKHAEDENSVTFKSECAYQCHWQYYEYLLSS